MSKKHATFGSPSSLYRNKHCPGNVTYTKDLPTPPPSEYAAEGTAFHDYMERAFPLYCQGEHSVVEDMFYDCAYEDMYDVGMETLADLHAKWIKFKTKHTGAVYHLELKVKLTDDIFGTSDVVFVGKNKQTGKTDVVVVDYKYGKGVPVSAENNLQGVAYLLGTIETLELDNIGVAMVIIAQVRLDNGWSQWEVNDLQAWKQTILSIVDRVKAVYNGEADVHANLSAGPWCRFCKANGKCEQQKKLMFDSLAITASEMPLDIDNAVRHLTLNEQVNIFLRKSQIEDFLDAVAKNLRAALETGVQHEAVKFVETKGRRKWAEDTDAVAEQLKVLGVADPYKKSLIGITEVERQIGKKKIDKLTVMGEGKLELVPASDRREAVTFMSAAELPEE